MVKSLTLGSSQIKAASEPPSWLGHLCDQTLTVRSSQLPSPWSAGNTYCGNLDRNAVFPSTLAHSLVVPCWGLNGNLKASSQLTRSRHAPS